MGNEMTFEGMTESFSKRLAPGKAQDLLEFPMPSMKVCHDKIHEGGLMLSKLRTCVRYSNCIS